MIGGLSVLATAYKVEGKTELVNGEIVCMSPTGWKLATHLSAVIPLVKFSTAQLRI